MAPFHRHGDLRMPASSLLHFQPPTIAAMAVLGTVLLVSMSAAADVLVVTDNQHPVQAPAGVRVVELDRAARLEADLAIGLPNTPDAASAVVQQRLRAGGDALQQRLAQAWQDVADAWSLGVTKLPAVVVDRRYVIYGEPDVVRAVARIKAFQDHRP